MGRPDGKIAIVTGAGRGIGRATAKPFAAEGAKIAVVSLTQANIDAVVADIEAAGGAALGISCHISDADQIKSTVDKVAATFGGIDILVNNAFDPSAVMSSVIDLSVEQLQRNFDMGPISYLRMMRHGQGGSARCPEWRHANGNQTRSPRTTGSRSLILGVPLPTCLLPPCRSGAMARQRLMSHQSFCFWRARARSSS